MKTIAKLMTKQTFNFMDLPMKGLVKSFDGVEIGDEIKFPASDLYNVNNYHLTDSAFLRLLKANLEDRAAQLNADILQTKYHDGSIVLTLISKL